MTRSIRRYHVVLLTFFLAPHVWAEDKPPVKPADARRDALVQAGYTPVPIAFIPGTGHCYANSAVGPEKAKFLLSSASQDTLIDLKLAKRLNLQLGEEVASIGEGGGAQVGRRTNIPGLMIGTYDTRKDWCVAARAADLSGQPDAGGGELGMDVLDRYAAIVDYPSRILYLRSPLENAWPRLAGTWTATSWREEGAARKLDAKDPPTLAFANRRMKLTDGGTTREYGIHLMPYNGEDVLLLFDPKQEGKPFPEILASGRFKVKDGVMNACLDLNKPKAIPSAFDAPKGSGYVLLELNCTAPKTRKTPADPLRDSLLQEGYTAVPMDREPEGFRTTVARINRHDLRLAVGIGSPTSEFDTAGLDKWGAERWGWVDALDSWGHKVKCEDARFRGMALGGYDTRRAWGIVNGAGVDLAGLNKAMAQYQRRSFQGLLGNLDLLTGSAVIDFGTNTLYLRPIKETVWPKLAGKWVGVRYESDGRKGQYNPGDAAIEFRDGRVRFTTAGGNKEEGFHLQGLGDGYRVGLFAPGADELADVLPYSRLGLLKLTEGTLTLVTTQATTTQVPEQRVGRGIGRRSGQPQIPPQTILEPKEFAAPAGSGLLLVEYERAK